MFVASVIRRLSTAPAGVSLSLLLGLLLISVGLSLPTAAG